MATTTHEVVNQPPPRVGLDEFAVNRALAEAVAAYGSDDPDQRGATTQHLGEIGRLVGSGTYQQRAHDANVHKPVLHTHDRYGHRIDEVEFHPAYHQLMADSIHHGAHASAWETPGPGAQVARAAAFMMFNQVEPGHCCPISMTYSVVPTLRHQPELAAEWEPRILSRDYRPELTAPGDKPGATFGMAMTEKQGGSDVRANSTRAVPVNGGGSGGDHLLTGHKWFCSAPMSDAFLVLARLPGDDTAPSCFLVPRILPDGTRNEFHIQRLKDKLGNSSNASSEIELMEAWATMVGEPGRGVRTIMEMVSHTRLDCIIGTAGGMRQSTTEAIWHARHRRAFGALLVDQPAMTAVLADLAVEQEAATWTALRLARAHEEGASEHDELLRRIATPVSKFWICKRGPNHAYEAMECLGGNGYTEDFPLARRYREAPVLAIWEGSGNVIALDVLRVMTREPAAVEAFLDEVQLAAGASSLLDEHISSLMADLDDAMPHPSPGHARWLTEQMALALQASLLVRHAPTHVADAFVATRMGPDRSGQYGTLPPGIDAAALVARHDATG